MIELAHELDLKMGVLKNSIKEGEGNFTGFCGELACKKYFGIPLDLMQNTYHHDIVVDEVTYDVKTKKRLYPPKSNWEGSVSDFNTSQKCMFYLHVSIYWPKNAIMPTSAFLCGYYPKEKYVNESRFLKKGELDGSNGFICVSDCWNMYYYDIYDVRNIQKEY